MAQVVAFCLNNDLVAAVTMIVSSVCSSPNPARSGALPQFVVDRQRRKQIGEAIVDGYRRIPRPKRGRLG